MVWPPADPSIRNALLEAFDSGDWGRYEGRFVEALQEAGKKGAALGLVAVSNDARKVFELARLDKVFAIHENLDAALAAGPGASQ